MANPIRSASVLRLVLLAMVVTLEQERRVDLIRTYIAKAKSP